MKQDELQKVLEQAAQERGCKVVDLMFNDDDNIFEVTIDRDGAPVDLQDCEHVHRAVLAAFDRNVEDYALTVGSVGISAEDQKHIDSPYEQTDSKIARHGAMKELTPTSPEHSRSGRTFRRFSHRASIGTMLPDSTRPAISS